MEALKPKTAPPPPKHTLEDAERAKQYSRLKVWHKIDRAVLSLLRRAEAALQPVPTRARR